MIETIQTTNLILAYMGVLGIFVTLVLTIDLFTKRKAAQCVLTYGVLVAFLAALGTAIMTLVYSEVFGLLPCGLCWLERVSIYGLVLLLGTALYYKDTFITRYGMVFSSVGCIISLYHHYIQMGGSEFIKCPTSGASCVQRFFFEFGFITFPLMGVIFFAFLLVLFYYVHKEHSRVNSAQAGD